MSQDLIVLRESCGEPSCEVPASNAAQRLHVLHELEMAQAPLSHREIMDRLGPSRWDPTTTFRNLNDFCEAGIVTRIGVGDHTWRFELPSHAPSSVPK